MTAFYRPVRPGVVESTEHTVGPWVPTDQHAGPPSALLVRALESVLPAPESAAGWLARVTVDLLGPIPVKELAVTARVVRPGRSVQLAEAELAVDGRPVARAGGWWHRGGDTAAVATVAPAPELPAGRPGAGSRRAGCPTRPGWSAGARRRCWSGRADGQPVRWCAGPAGVRP